MQSSENLPLHLFCFQDGAFAGLLAKDFSGSSHGPSCTAAWMSSQHSSSSYKEGSKSESKEEAAMLFMTTSHELHAVTSATFYLLETS